MKSLSFPDEYTGKTVLAYSQAVNRFNRWNGRRLITPRRVLEHFAFLRENYRPASIRLAKTALRKCYNMDWSKVHTGRPPAAPPKTAMLDRRTIGKLVKDPCRKTGVMVEFLYLTGVRIDECLKVRIADCLQVERKIQIRTTGKGGNDRMLTISGRLFKKIVSTFHSEEYLFQSGDGHYTRSWAWKKIRRAGKRIGRPDLHPHQLRHAIATRLLDEGENLVAVADFLGHSSVATTSRYYRGRVKEKTLQRIENSL